MKSSSRDDHVNPEEKRVSMLDAIDQMEDDAFFEETNVDLPSNVRMEEKGLKVDTTDGRNVETE